MLYDICARVFVLFSGFIVCGRVCLRRSEDNLWGLVFFYRVDSGDPTQVMRLGRKCFYQTISLTIVN